ncbi:hypothetical protein HG530_008916 [Fusarium avenaceum]|nr:hypothetical protein HG530_008916 [Fusarium avenaceum]
MPVANNATMQIRALFPEWMSAAPKPDNEAPVFPKRYRSHATLGVKSVLVAGVRSLGKRLELGTLGNQADGSTALGDIALNLLVLVDGDTGLLNHNEVLALVVLQALVACHESLGQQVCVGVLGLVQLDTRGTGFEVECSTEELLVLLIGHEANAVGKQGSTAIGNSGSLAVLTLVLGAILIEDAAVVLDDAHQGLTGTGVDTGDLEVLDGRIKVLGRVCDIDDELEAL